MNPEHGLFFEGVEGLVEVLVVLILKFGRSLCPDWVDVVDDIVFIFLDFLPVLPFGLLAENHGYWHELAILAEKGGDAALARVFFAFLVYPKGYHGAPIGLGAVFHLVFGAAVAGPFHRLCAFLP